MARTVRPTINDEEFQDYLKLIDNAEVEFTPFTLPSHPPSGAAPSRSGQNRGGGWLEIDDINDTGASGSGTRLDHPSPLRC